MKKIKIFIVFITNFIFVMNNAGALSSKDKFEEALNNTTEALKHKLKQHKKPFLNAELIKSLAGKSRIRGRLIKIDEESVLIDQNNLYFQKDDDVCVQEAISIKKYYGLRTVCIREDYILMDFTFRYKKAEF